jgi:hypothetical protein
MASWRDLTAHIVVTLIGIIIVFSALLFSTGDFKNLAIGIGSSVLASVVVSFLLLMFIGNPFADLDKRLRSDFDLLGLANRAGLTAIWTSRSDVPLSMWIDGLRAANREVLIVASAMQFLSEREDFLRLINQKSQAGCLVSILLQDPDSDYQRRRSEEEGDTGSIRSRVQTTVGRLQTALTGDHSELRFFDQVLYNSIFCFDEIMIVTPHMFGIAGAGAPTFIVKYGSDTLYEKYKMQFYSLRAVSYLR